MVVEEENKDEGKGEEEQQQLQSNFPQQCNRVVIILFQ